MATDSPNIDPTTLVFDGVPRATARRLRRTLDAVVSGGVITTPASIELRTYMKGWSERHLA